MKTSLSCKPYPDPDHEYSVGWEDDGITTLIVRKINSPVVKSMYFEKAALLNIVQLAIDYGLYILSDKVRQYKSLELALYSYNGGYKAVAKKFNKGYVEKIIGGWHEKN